MHESEPVNPCVEKTIALVFETFRGVTREGGVSWSESMVLDQYGGKEECRDARFQDNESGWEALANDPHWDSSPGIGGFSFLDPIGFRYYLAPAMVKDLRGQGGSTGSLPFHLEFRSLQSHHWLDQWSRLLPLEIQCICEFLKCMDTVESEQYSPYYPSGGARKTEWERAYRSHWVNLDANPLPE